MEKIEVGEVISIFDENDEEHDVEVLGVVDIKGTYYIAVILIEDLERDTEEELDIFFLKIDQDGDLLFIESDEEFEEVSNTFANIFDENEK